MLELIGSPTDGLQSSAPETDESAVGAGSTRTPYDPQPGLHRGFGDAGELLDDKTRIAYRKRLTELRENLDDARQGGDPDAAAAAEAEIDALSRELSRAIGWGGRSRRAASATERARVSVTKAIKYTIDKIEQNDPALARQLTRTINTGTFCAYNPGAVPAVQWDFGVQDQSIHRRANPRLAQWHLRRPCNTMATCQPRVR